MDVLGYVLDPEFITIAIGLAGTFITIYAGFSTRMTVLEKSVDDLEKMVNEMRLDIKSLLASHIINK